MRTIVSTARTKAFILSAMVLVAFGCSSGNHYMSEALESRPESELMTIEVSADHDPGVSYLGRQSLPYVIDGQEIPYEWTASGNHVIYLDPGEHIFEGYIDANVHVLPAASDPASLILVYDIRYRYDDDVAEPLHGAIRSGEYGVRFTLGQLRTISVSYTRDVIEYQWPVNSRPSLVPIIGKFNGTARKYSWIEIINGMTGISFEVEQVAGRVKNGLNITEFTFPLDGSRPEIEVVGEDFVDFSYYIDNVRDLSRNIGKTQSFRDWWADAQRNNWQSY